MIATAVAVAAAAALASVSAQPFQPNTGFLPAGSLRTSDYDGPYDLSLLSTQARVRYARQLHRDTAVHISC
jgi:hypothetical protein